ncbi:MAG: FAD-dependent oxidoreductase [Chitinophagia bacterium]
MHKIILHTIFCLSAFVLSCSTAEEIKTDILVIGGSASGTTAAIQSARMGVSTMLVEETQWLGGMISAAGVSAFDGNHNIPSGLWNEFRDSIYQQYGGPDSVATGWVSNTHFEPHIADRIFKSMTGKENNLTVKHGWQFNRVLKTGNKISGAEFIDLQSGKLLKVNATVMIDATELGDAIADAGIAHDIGFEPEAAASENIKVEESAKGIIQDLTYVAILKDYGKDADCTIARPRNYFPGEFDGACTDFYKDTARKKPSVDAATMLNYAKLPNGKFMINWPNFGNDHYFNPIPLSKENRDSGYASAKEQTLRFIYFIQHQLGFKHLGLADDEFPTPDRLALIPYHRESRRIKGIVRFDMVTLSDPFGKQSSLYRTGIAVGDYPVDHHHKKNPQAPQQLDFYPVPSFSIPLGALIPKNSEGIIAAEKSISVSNIINGATRLQPCVMLIGQAAGTLAAVAVKSNLSPDKVPVRSVQSALLDQKAMLLPYFDATLLHPHFKSIQKIGATGILRGKGIPYKWANQTWFYPDQLVSSDTLKVTADGWLAVNDTKGAYITFDEAKAIVTQSATSIYGVNIKPTDNAFLNAIAKAGLDKSEGSALITRAQFAVLIDQLIDPFTRKSINHLGEIQPL